MEWRGQERDIHNRIISLKDRKSLDLMRLDFASSVYKKKMRLSRNNNKEKKTSFGNSDKATAPSASA